MSIRLSEEEAWAELARAHTGIFTTLTRDGWPISLPMWFAAVDRRIYLRTPSKSKKLARIRQDTRGNFLVERGERWRELCAVMLRVEVQRIEPGEEFDRAAEALVKKYAGFAESPGTLTDATRQHYSDMVMLRLTPVGPAITWDNARIRRRTDTASKK
jgi:nitroimidazol reductase NimA-like FMN-containing flavoprotein (pyridoxamine 5'-phosphate oxidase superfamily)